MSAPSSRLRRRVVVGGAGLVTGVLGGWLAGLLRGPRPGAPGPGPGRP